MKTERELVKKMYQLHSQGINERNKAVDVWGQDACYEHLKKRDDLFQERDKIQDSLRKKSSK